MGGNISGRFCKGGLGEGVGSAVSKSLFAPVEDLVMQAKIFLM